VQIDVPEKLGITDRAQFYDATGAVLDMLVTHLFQVAAEVAMEKPASLKAADLQAAREEVIGCFRPIDPDEVVLGQFEGYRDVDGVADDSTRDTYVAARLWIDNDRWRDVPFLLRTGKRLAASKQTVSLILREPTGTLADVPKNGNVLSLDLSGSGAIELRLVAKRPGPSLDLEVADIGLALAALPDGDPLPPYVRLINDVLVGDRSLFTRPDGLASVWKAAECLLDDPPTPRPYAPGSWGPAEAGELAAPDGWLLGQ
jgi:glucose-6-phosphate 1-dehydrogenase